MTGQDFINHVSPNFVDECGRHNVLELVVSDAIEARRAKGAQYTGIDKTIRLSGQILSGVILSVLTCH